MNATKSAVEMERAAIILRLLGDTTRLTMLKVMEKGACCVCEFVSMFDISQPAISQHLKKLKELELVQEEKRGQWVFYSLNVENSYYPFIKTILQQLPSQQERLNQLKEQGKRIECC